MHESQKLTDAEWKIMQRLWESSPKTLMQLTHELEQETTWSRHTVIALLKRMQEKGTVRVTEDGRAKLFFANVSREDVEREQTDQLMKRLFGGRAFTLASKIVERGEMDEQELNALEKLIDEARKNGTR